MKIGSIKEDLAYEKRISITPDSAKSLIGLGLKICIEKNYATHLGIEDKDYEVLGVEIKQKPEEVIVKENQMFFTPPMVEHAMVFTKQTKFITWGRNSRVQEVYEADVFRIPPINP